MNEISKEEQIFIDKKQVLLEERQAIIDNFNDEHNKLFLRMEYKPIIDQILDLLSDNKITLDNAISILDWTKEEIERMRIVRGGNVPKYFTSAHPVDSVNCVGQCIKDVVE